MKLSTTIFLTILLLTQSAHAITLRCDVVTEVDTARLDFNRGPKQSIINSYSPQKQIHILDLNKKIAVYKNFNAKTKIYSIDENTVKWKFIDKQKQKQQAQALRIVYKFTYFRKTNKLATTIDFAGNYVDFESTSGDCSESK
jgi:hypothetical protein